MKSIDRWIEFFLQEVPKEITITRWEHCLRVAHQAERLATINGFHTPKMAFLAGITHDITKQKKKEFHLNLFEHVHDIELDGIPEEAYHAFSAEIYLATKYGFQNQEIFSAIRSHTLGKVEMSELDKILYASDFLGSEFAFKQNQLEDWVLETEKNLHFGIYLKASKTINQLLDSKSKIHKSTIETYNQNLAKL
ncbi:bis(5'-nucleosyl)-tetraphosphatase (symmetrical) YqeK [Leptospira ognonensis]|nr:bis(5'-nucleosyl)-tetraphosphatase (symmetrical) YqeK [Leptospira ognonensis]